MTPDMSNDHLITSLSASQSEPDWLLDRRLKAWAKYESLPMPVLTDEKWRRTDLGSLNPTGFSAFGDNGHTDNFCHAEHSPLATVELAGQNIQVD